MNLNRFVNNKVVKAGSWYTVTEFFLKGITFLTIPIFTRLLSTSDYGQASLYLTWVAIFTILIGLNLNTSITRGKYDYSEDYDSFVSSVMFLSLLVFIIYIAIFVIFESEIEKLIGFDGFLLYFMLFQAYFAFVRNSLITKFRVEYNYKKISIISIAINIMGVISSIFLIKFIFNNTPFLGKVIGEGIFIIIFGVVFLIYMIKNNDRKLINIRYWKYALTLSLPLILHSLSGIINSQFDRIIISKYIGDAATGLYSFAYNVGMIITVLTHALDQAWAPFAYEKMQEGNFEDLKRKAVIYRDFYTIAYSILLMISPEIIKLMAAEAYWESLVIIPYIFAGYYFSYMYTLEVKTEFYYKKTSLISLGTIASALINIVLNLIFIPKYGYVAAAITTTVSYLFLFIFHFLITRNIIRKSIYGFRFHMKSLFYMLTITGYYSLFTNFLIIRLIGIIISITVGIILIKNNSEK